MRAFPFLSTIASPLVLGGCFLAYPYDAYDDDVDLIEQTPACSVICGSKYQCESAVCYSTAWATRFGDPIGEQELADLDWHDDGTIALTGSYIGGAFEFAPSGLSASPDDYSWFLALLNAQGEPQDALTVNGIPDGQPSQGFGVAMNDAGLFTVGSTKVMGVPDFDGFITRYDRKVELSGQSSPSYLYGGSDPDYAVAIDNDDQDAYLIGKMTDYPAEYATCPLNGEQFPFVEGMYVMKLGPYGECTWFRQFKGTIEPLAIAATDVINQGLWISGTFTGTMTLPTSASNLEAANGVDAFLIKLDESGNVIFQERFAGHIDDIAIVPSALAVSPKSSIVYMGGQLRGSSEFKPNLQPKQTAGFLAAFNTQNIETVQWSMVFPSGATESSGANVTDIVTDDQNVYLAGVFGETITIPSGGKFETLNAPAANPFFARIASSTHDLNSFQSFSGGGELFTNQKVSLARTSDGFLIGTTWQSTIDLSTFGTKATINALPNAVGTNVVLAKLQPLP